MIIDYGLGNLASVANMFKKIGTRDVVISKDKAVIAKAEKLLLPGVGAFDAGISRLREAGLEDVLNEKVLVQQTPILGICLGMQLLTRRSEEGREKGLGWIDADTVKFNPDPAMKLKVPNMGWNYVTVKKQNPLIGMDARRRFYFVHSYFVKCDTADQVLATAVFGNEFTCMVNKNNIYGAQFHPEKSLKFGMDVLKNFSYL